MRENYQASILLVVLGSTLGGLLFFVARGLLPSVPAPTPPPPDGQPMQAQTLQYEVRTLPKSTVYLLRIPAHSRFRVVPAISDQVDTLETFARRHGAIAVINGGFFDPMNQQSTSYVMQQGTLVADPKQNQRLVNNPNLTPYLEQIFDRSELRRYQCGQGGQGGQGFRYAITRHQAPPLTGCQLVDALGAGPQLLPNTTAVEEGFWATAAGEVIRDSLGSRQANARSAVGMTSDGNLVWVMVAQRTEAPTSSGM
ncbi:MAG: phosphodiester glycosidase family protein, partial [Kovacikia sp.]